MGEVMPRHFDDLVLNRIGLMKSLHHTVVSGLVGGLAGSLLGAAAFLTVDALMPSTAEAQWPSAETSVMTLPRTMQRRAVSQARTI